MDLPYNPRQRLPGYYLTDDCAALAA
jgi:hypothetical protein